MNSTECARCVDQASWSEDEHTSLCLPLGLVVSLVLPPTAGEISAKLQAVIPQGLCSMGQRPFIAGVGRVSRASLSQLWGKDNPINPSASAPSPCPAGRRVGMGMAKGRVTAPVQFKHPVTSPASPEDNSQASCCLATPRSLEPPQNCKSDFTAS